MPELKDRFALASELARKHLQWEGDVRDEGGGDDPWWVPVPTGNPWAYDYILAWKQDHCGITFIASPYRLPWLQRAGKAFGSIGVQITRDTTGVATAARVRSM